MSLKNRKKKAPTFSWAPPTLAAREKATEHQEGSGAAKTLKKSPIGKAIKGKKIL